ncbi:MAG: hypothetical protein EOM50_24225 [Erysipelotrichia bacterium]|nr:hypothetical protein [Erysipelotrichia bacterium]
MSSIFMGQVSKKQKSYTHCCCWKSSSSYCKHKKCYCGVYVSRQRRI